jgi:malic enzyme
VDEAIAHYQKALQINPDDAEAQNNLARVPATCPQASLRDGNKAVELAQRANQLTGGGNPVVLGTLDVRARRINEPMKLAAAHAITGCIARRELSPEYFVPSVFNRDVVKRVAAAVTEAAIKTGVARKGLPRR